MERIRNFVIIAHIDSGKSTLADRLLEITGTVPVRSMQPQYLDRLPLERERGITIKMAPVRMKYKYSSGVSSGDSGDGNSASARNGNGRAVERLQRGSESAVIASIAAPATGSVLGEVPSGEYILNLIDTPGHSDFSYEVSRALAAVEGAVLLIDGTKGIQAQTLSNLRSARRAGLTIIPAINKIDLALPNIEKTIQSVAELLEIGMEEIFRVSAKSGAGVKELLDEVVRRVPPPRNADGAPRALIFDSLYDDHKGIISFVRVFGGAFRVEEMRLLATGGTFKPKEVGYFSPSLTVAQQLHAGEIGYIATGLKEPSLVKIGDTVAVENPGGSGKIEALSGYREPAPVVFISFYPDAETKYDDLKRAFEKLHLNDAALSFEPDANEALGRGLKVGFLGQLHFEITASRLEGEYNLSFLTSFPSIAYRVQDQGKIEVIKQPQDFPEKPEKVWEPIVSLEMLSPQKYLSAIVSLQTVFDLEVGEVKTIGDNLLVQATMPLRELIRDFDDRLKSATQGYASFTYELTGERESEVEKLEILVVDEVVPALTRIVPKKDLEREGRQTVERLKELLPKEQFTQAIQAKALGRIIARETIPAMKKLLGNFGKTGGDRTRKMKLWKKQKRGKEKLQSMARVELSPEVFREILKK